MIEDALLRIAIRSSHLAEDNKENVPISEVELLGKIAYDAWLSAQQGVHLTAFGVGMLAFLAGFGICWFVFVR